MIETLVRYLRSQNVPFRVYSYASPEPLPAVGHRIPEGGQLVSTAILLVEARPTIAVMPLETTPNFAALSAELDALVTEGKIGDLPPPFDHASEPIPPFGGALGIATIADHGVTGCSILVFRAFSPHDFVEVPYEDFARLEQPRVSSFAVAGELDTPERMHPRQGGDAEVEETR